MKTTGLFQLILIILGGLVLLFIIAPLLGMFLKTTPGNLFETSQDPEVMRSVWLTLWTSMAATLIFAIGAIPLAYLLVRRNFRFKPMVLGIINLPVVIPHSAAGIAILGFISRDTVIGKAASLAGFDFVSTPAGIALAMAFVSLPFLVNSAMDGFAGVPVRLENAGLNLGASPARVFFTVSLPLAWRNVVTGLILMFARGMSEFGAVVIVAYHPMITPVLIFERFGAFGLKYARPVAVLFILVSLAVFIVLRLLTKDKSHAKN
ncbi:MAG TPA: ABC transporter permease [Bacteroidales bacterium]|nr:ABC transporter permease [Bacteroidales bacterium]HNS46241.1 ABC transporter permease [Bacteroidales bacterium]